MNPTLAKLAGCALAALSFVSPGCSKNQPDDPAPGAVGRGQVVFLGTYTRGWACPQPGGAGAPCSSKGIYRTTFDPSSGSLGPIELAAESDNPSYLAISPNGRFLYAVNEVGDYQGQKTGAVSAFAIEEGGKLRLINQVTSHGADPCHVSLDRTGNTVLVANYSGGTVASYRVGSGGELVEASHHLNAGQRGPHKNQDAAHAHYIAEGPTPGRVYVADLGLDRVLIYDLDPATSKLTASATQPFVMVSPPGSGPRHLAFHPTSKFLYTNNELSTGASVFSLDAATGKLGPSALQTVSTIPLPYGSHSDNGEIQILPSGKFAYVSNRGHDSISAFSIDEAGKLQLIESVPSGGKAPRDFKVDPTGQFLLVANQVSDDILVLKIDQTTGKLEPTRAAAKLSKVVNFAFWSGMR